VALDGSIATQSDNVLIYATSNRRHLMPEKMSDNTGYTTQRRWRAASGRGGRGEDLAVGAVWRVAVVLSVPAGRLPGDRGALAIQFRLHAGADRGGARRGAAMGAWARLAFRARAWQFAKDYAGKLADATDRP
jgi:hypothetical protein